MQQACTCCRYDIDPSVMIDDDGQAYLFWGNHVCYYAKLKENMAELDGGIKTIQLTHIPKRPGSVKEMAGIIFLMLRSSPKKLCTQ